MKIYRIRTKTGSLKIALYLVAFFIQLNTIQAQKRLSPTSRLTYVALDTHDDETKNVSNNTPVAFKSAFGITKGPFAAYAQSWNEKYKKTDTVEAVVLNLNSVTNIRTLSNYHKNHNFKCSVKGVSSIHNHDMKETIKEEKTERKNKKHKMRINLGKETRLIN